MIEGAHEGAGLGLDFFAAHRANPRPAATSSTSRGRSSEPVDRFRAINEELSAYGAHLLERPMLVVATKTDAIDDPGGLERLHAHALETGREFFAISAVTGEGLDALKRRVGLLLEEMGTGSRVLGVDGDGPGDFDDGDRR